MLPNMNRLMSTPFFQNKIVLYGSLVLVLLSILRHLANENVNAIVLMALIGLITSYFSKNMIIVLITAFGSVFILEMIGSPGVTEGMENKKKDDDDDSKKDKKKDSDPIENIKKKVEDKLDDDKKDDKKDKKDVKKEGVKSRNSSKQGMTKLSPANYDGKKGKDDDDNTANRIDYASTLEQAYDNIENIIGEDGVRGLTDQTKSLMNQQKLLMQNMKEMGPLLKSAEGFMEQITGNGGIQGITSMLKGFATPGGAKNDKD